MYILERLPQLGKSDSKSKRERERERETTNLWVRERELERWGAGVETHFQEI